MKSTNGRKDVSSAQTRRDVWMTRDGKEITRFWDLLILSVDFHVACLEVIGHETETIDITYDNNTVFSFVNRSIRDRFT